MLIECMDKRSVDDHFSLARLLVRLSMSILASARRFAHYIIACIKLPRIC